MGAGTLVAGGGAEPAGGGWGTCLSTSVLRTMRSTGASALAATALGPSAGSLPVAICSDSPPQMARAAAHESAVTLAVVERMDGRRLVTGLTGLALAAVLAFLVVASAGGR